MRDISKIQAEALIPLLTKSNERNLCFINIAGGASSDSINTLFLFQQINPLLLKNRRIDINVLDIDRFGPAFTDLHDFETVDWGAIAALKISRAIKPRFLGINGLKSIIENTGNNKWNLGIIIEGNPRYLIFILKKK